MIKSPILPISLNLETSDKSSDSLDVNFYNINPHYLHLSEEIIVLCDEVERARVHHHSDEPHVCPTDLTLAALCCVFQV